MPDALNPAASAAEQETATPERVERRGRRAPRGGAGAFLRRLDPWIWLPVLVYVLLVLLGVTTSSIGISNLREDPAHASGLMLGSGNGVRGDEYLTSTPLALGVTVTGDGEDQNPLTAEQGVLTLLPSTPVSSVVFADGAALKLGTVLPDQMLVAARWWLPVLLLFLGAPAFFRTLTGSRWTGLFATSLIFLSPSVQWWSLTPVIILGFTFGGAAALQRAALSVVGGRVSWRTITWGLAAALILARTPFHYQPWAIMLAPPVIFAAIVPFVVGREGRRRALVVVAAVGAGALALAGLVFWENLASLRAALGTVYPGSRLSSGEPNPFQQIFGATNLAGLKTSPVVNSNQSEISSSFTVLVVLAALLLAAGVRFRDRAHHAAVVTVAVITGCWFAWAMVSFGALGAHIPVVNRVPPTRAADALGHLAVLLVCLVLPAAARRGRLTVALLAGGGSALVSAYAGSLLAVDNLPTLTTKMIWLSAAVVGAVTFLLAYRPGWWAGYVAGGLGAFLLVWQVNPVLFGLGDLRGSEIAQELIEQGDAARADGTVWASDDWYTDALLAATGVPSLSGRQMAGPDEQAWRELDPDEEYRDVWNRGGSHIQFQWTADDGVAFSNPNLDAIRLTGAACAVAERYPDLGHVMSSHELDEPCLTEVGTFSWNGADRWIYQVAAPGRG